MRHSHHHIGTIVTRWPHTLRAAGLAAITSASLYSPAQAQSAVVLSTDFATGYYSTLALAPPHGTSIDIESTCADAVVRAHGNRVYSIGRFGCDHVQVIDAANGATLTQWSTGNGTNPQDIEIMSSTKAYVSLFETDYVGIFNPQTGASLGQISLAGFSDADGLPETTEMVLVGNLLFIALERLDRPGGFLASNPSYLAVVDCTTDQLVDVDPNTNGVQGILLTGRNPLGELILDAVRQKIVVAEVGNFGVQDGGAEFVDPVTLTAEGFFITEAALGGDVNAVRLWTDCTGYAIVNDSSFNTNLVRLDWCAETVAATCLATTGFRLSDVEIHTDGTIFLADRALMNPGVRLFQAPGCTEITATPIGFGLPPQDIAFVLADTPSSLPAPPRATSVQLLPNRPNPFNPSTTLRFVAPAGEHVALEILDLRGRRVAGLWNGPVDGEKRVEWQGRDARGRAMPSGVYVARLQGNATTATRLLTLVR